MTATEVKSGGMLSWVTLTTYCHSAGKYVQWSMKPIIKYAFLAAHRITANLFMPIPIHWKLSADKCYVHISTEAIQSSSSGPALCYPVHTNIVLIIWKVCWFKCSSCISLKSWLRNWLQMPGSLGLVQKIIGDYSTSSSESLVFSNICFCRANTEFYSYLEK